jgi:membrane protein DedA with SNARE-associated domain
MLSWIEQVITTLGYPGIAFLMFIEVIIPPIPSEFIMPLGGFSASRGHLSSVGVILAGTVGSMAGAYVFYGLGRVIGIERLVRLADAHGKWLTLSGDEICKAQAWFVRYGSFIVVLLCRFVPGIRSQVSIPAGVARMPLLFFTLYTFLGTLVWNSALTVAGSLLGNQYQLVDQYFGQWGTPVLAVLMGVAIIIYMIRLIRQIRQAPSQVALVAKKHQPDAWREVAQPPSRPERTMQLLLPPRDLPPDAQSSSTFSPAKEAIQTVPRRRQFRYPLRRPPENRP